MSNETAHQSVCACNRTWLISPSSLLVGGLDLAIIHLWLSARIDTHTALLEHALVAVVVCTVAIVWQRRVAAETVVIGGAMLLLGPLGGIVLLIIELGSGLTRFEMQRMERASDVYNNNARRLMAQMRQNRRPALQGPPPVPFANVLRSGTLTQQQDAIAAILRHYTPELLPLLRQALASPVPAIRVQAAAVYAKLRGSFEARAKAALAAANDPEGIMDPVAFAAEAEAVAGSGFADPEIQHLLHAVAARALQPSCRAQQVTGQATRSRDGAVVQSAMKLVQAPNPKRYSCGGIA